MTTLKEKKANFTRDLLIDSAIELVQEEDISELSFKSISNHAGVSERTMFRYFENRDAFLNQLTVRMHAQLQLPSLLDSTRELSTYLNALYKHLEKKPRMVEVLLDSVFLRRVLDTTAKDRLEELKALLAQDYPHCPQDLILKTAANIRYIMSASSWRYYRFYFGFDLGTSIHCAEILVKQSLSLLDSMVVDKHG